MRCRPDTAPAPDPFPAAGGPLLTAEQERALATSIREADRAAAELADIVEGDPDRFTRLLGTADEGPVSPAEFAHALRRYKQARCDHATATGLGDGDHTEGPACLLQTVRAGLARLAASALLPPERARLEAIERGGQSRNHLAERNLGLVIDIAVRHTRRLARMMPAEDRIGEGIAGLLRAVESYDPERGARFSTYAYNWVRQSIRKAMAAQGAPIRVPEHGARLLRRFNARKEEMALRSGGRQPPEDRVLRDLQLPPGEVESLRRALDVSGRMPWTGRGPSAASEGAPPGGFDFPSEVPLGADRLIFQEDWRRVQGLLDTLPALERQVLVHRFGLDGAEPKTLQEIGEVLRLTREGVRQVELRALRRLRGKLAG